MCQDPSRLSLRNALLAWCFEERVEDLQAYEVYFTSQELATFGYPNLGGASNRGDPVPMGTYSYESLREALDNAWKGILLDFRERVQRGQIHLRGVQTEPKRQLIESCIPGQWAADYSFDVLAGTIQVGEFRYVGVAVLLGPADAAVTAAPSTARAALRAEDVADFDDDTILALLEEHAKRVVESSGAKLIEPGKVSVMPIVRRKMSRRAETGELALTLADEARDLAAWIATKVPSHQVPTAGRIENALRHDYRRLKPQSNGTKPRLKN